MSPRTYVRPLLIGVLGALAACHTARTLEHTTRGAGTAERDGSAVGAAAGESPWRKGADDAAGAYDVEHYSIELDVDPTTRTIQGRCTVRLWPVRSALRSVTLDLAGLDVRAVHDGVGRALTWTRDDESLSVACAESVPVGTFVELAIDYGGAPRRGLWFAAPRDGVPTQAFTHGECIDARGWFPCHDVPDDRATTEISVTMPSAWTAIAAGERIDRVEHAATNSIAARATERWRMTFPHPPYLTTLVAGELAVENDEWDGIPLVYAGPVALRQNLRSAFAETDDVLAFLSKATGARYPYSKYAQTAVDNFPFGGMENVSATTMTDTMVPDEQGLADRGAEGLVAHEAAHQWFGDLLTCRDWSHAWLNEGFATYFAALYTESSRGHDAFAREMRGLRDVYLMRDVGANRRPIVYWRAGDPLELFFTGHVYQGAAVRLHHLRAVLGDDAFFRGVRRYVGSHRGGSVTTDDVRVAMERESGSDLGWFFRQWFLSPGYPEVRSSWRYDESTNEVALTLEQTQDPADGTPAVFRLPIDVAIGDATASSTRRVEMTDRRQEFRWKADTQPTWLLVDPWDTVPMSLDEAMSRAQRDQLVRFGGTSGELRAVGCVARELRELRKRLDARTASSKSEFLAYRRETVELRTVLATHLDAASPDVREFSARNMGLVDPAYDEVEKGSSLRLGLMKVVRFDRDTDTRVAALESLAAMGPDEELYRFTGDALTRAEGWTMRGALVGARAAAAPDKALSFLIGELEQQHSAHGSYEAHVLATLARLDDPRVRTILLSWALDATRADAARAVAIRELARRARDADTRDALVPLLASPRFRIRREAIEALATFDDATARGALEEHARRTPISRERGDVERLLSRARSQG